jgi:hypothetical protein
MLLEFMLDSVRAWWNRCDSVWASAIELRCVPVMESFRVESLLGLNLNECL